MRFRAGEVAEATAGELVGPDVGVNGVSIDSRSIETGQLFVPIVGERDGHDFIDPERGPYLTARAPVGGTAIVVADTATALLALGVASRARLPDRVVGITGSVGKTTVKDLLGSVLRQRYRTAITPGNFNNELGLPITLVNADEDAEAVVLEMGARGVGHITELCAVGRPSVGIVTAVAAVHTEVFGSIDDVARGKSELVRALPPQGTAVLNADDDRVAAMAKHTTARVISYGVERNADLHASAVSFDDELRASFRLHSPWGERDVSLGVSGLHQVSNALAAAAGALAMAASLEDLEIGLADASLSHWRMEMLRTPSGVRIINDAYNASPMSVSSALHALARLDAGHRIAFLGTMAELGDGAADAHREIAQLAASLGIRVIAVGEPMYGTEIVGTIDEAAVLAGDADAILVKGSRVAGLERLAVLLLET